MYGIESRLGAVCCILFPNHPAGRNSVMTGYRPRLLSALSSFSNAIDELECFKNLMKN